MTTPDRLFELIPAIYRLRDKELGGYQLSGNKPGGPLQHLLKVIEAQLEDVEGGIDQLYDDMFIETCQGPLIDYFAELVAVRLPPLTPTQARDGSDAAAWVSRRHQVVNVIAARAAKGTLSALERVVADATGWPVRAVEQGVHLAVTQSVRHLDLRRGRLLDTHDDAPLLLLGSSFATASAQADVRRGDSTRSKPVGPHPTTVTITVWRQEIAHVHRAPAACVDDDDHYTFDPLGDDQQLAVAPTTRRPGAPPAGDLDLPVPISRRQLRHNLADYYGTDRSLCIYRGHTPVPPDEIVVTDLSGWAHDPDYGQVAVDPQTGRIAFPPADESDDAGIWVRYHHLAVGPLGAGTAESATPTTFHTDAPKVITVSAESDDPSTNTSISAALQVWASLAREGATDAIIDIVDSSLYEEDFDIRVGAGQRLEIRAAAGQRPVLRSIDEQHNRPKRVRVEGHSVKGQTTAPRLRLAGLTIADHALELRGHFGAVAIDRCTIVPARDDSDRRHVAVAVGAMPCAIDITSSIIGWMRIQTPEVGYDPIELTISDSIVDAGPQGGHAISGPEERPAYAALSLTQSTVLGGINVFATRTAQDSIITGRFYSRCRQTGEIRFCYLPTTSHVPRRTGCQPDGVLARARDRIKLGDKTAEPLLTSEPERVRPRFDSTRFGSPGYGRLALDAAAEITHGSEDDGELGAFHDQWLTRRIDDMTARLAEFNPIGVDLDIMFAN
jgi:hypothetical protein